MKPVVIERAEPRGIRALLKRFRADRAGNVMMVMVLALPAIIGSAGLAVDTVQWTLWTRQLQRAADSGALAGAYALAQSQDVDESVTRDLQTNNDRALSALPVIETPPTVGAFAGSTSAVRVVLQTSQRLAFTGFFLPEAPVFQVEGTAAIIQNGDYCVISLEDTSTVGITLIGNATVDLGCGMASNSRSRNAIDAGGSAVVRASPIAAVGGLSPSGAYQGDTQFLPYSLPQPDPFADLPNPAPTGCSGKVTVNPTQTRTISPGCYRGFDFKGTVTLDPGVYFIDGSDVKFGSQSVVTGAGVTIILTSSTAATNPASIATIDINGGATVDITAPSTGTYAGVAFYQDRRANDGSSNVINGNSSSRYQGAFYFPRQEVTFNGTSGIDIACIQLVGRRVKFSGNSQIINDCPANSGVPDFVGAVVRLVG